MLVEKQSTSISPASHQTTTKSDKRQPRRVSSFHGSGGRCCGTSKITLFGRLLLLSPMPILCVLLLYVNQSRRTSLSADVARTLFAVTAWACFVVSRFITFASKDKIPGTTFKENWTTCAVLEVFVILLTTAVATVLVYPPEKVIKNWDSPLILVRLLRPYLFPLLVLPILHLLIKQIMLAQRRALSGWLLDTASLFFGVIVVVFSLCAYAQSVLMGKAMINSESVNILSLALSSDFTCKDAASFGRLFINNSLALSACPDSDPENLMALIRQGVISSVGSIGSVEWCGFHTWNQACWGIGITPASFAVRDEVVISALHIYMMFMVTRITSGSGVVSRNKKGGLDIESVNFLLKPSTAYIIFALGLVNTLITIMHVSHLTINGSLLSGPVPTPPPEKIVLPSYCYGKCVDYLYYYFTFNLSTALMAVCSEYIQRLNCLCIRIDNHSINDRRALRGLRRDSSVHNCQHETDLLTVQEHVVLMQRLITLDSQVMKVIEQLEIKEWKTQAKYEISDDENDYDTEDNEDHHAIQPPAHIAKFIQSKEFISKNVGFATDGLQKLLCVDDDEVHLMGKR